MCPGFDAPTSAAGDEMGLSDRDRRVLTEIARRMHAEDPRLATALARGRFPRRVRWSQLAVTVLALSLAGTGVAQASAPLVLVATVVLVVTFLRSVVSGTSAPAADRDNRDPPAAPSSA